MFDAAAEDSIVSRNITAVVFTRVYLKLDVIISQIESFLISTAEDKIESSRSEEISECSVLEPKNYYSS